VLSAIFEEDFLGFSYGSDQGAATMRWTEAYNPAHCPTLFPATVFGDPRSVGGGLLSAQPTV
jgi:hypothetical protein